MSFELSSYLVIEDDRYYVWSIFYIGSLIFSENKYNTISPSLILYRKKSKRKDFRAKNRQGR